MCGIMRGCGNDRLTVLLAALCGVPMFVGMLSKKRATMGKRVTLIAYYQALYSRRPNLWYAKIAPVIECVR